ncbi:MAG TPA: hypothetical protein VGR00_13910 [Thermoanaerobaculia bacterium]|nr:hypothetical protein [Thermoanaerobaculia bacterium]
MTSLLGPALGILLLLEVPAFAGEVSEVPSQVPSSEDGAVLTAVFENLVIRRGPRLPLSLSSRPPRTIHVTMTPPSIEPTNYPWLVSRTLKATAPVFRSDATAAYQGSQKRSLAREAISYSSSNARVVVAPAEGKGPGSDIDASHVIAAYPPGYSRGVALVKLYFADIYHPSLAVYVLNMKNGRWTVVSSQFLNLS